MDLRRIAITVTGRVQGVGYRYFTQETAEALGVTGWVRNGWNREVEIEAQADPGTLDVFCGRLREGPSLARVEHLRTHDLPVIAEESSFEVRT